MLYAWVSSIRFGGTAIDRLACGCAEFDETVVILSRFKDLADPQHRGKVSYPLEEILLLCVLARAESFVDIALFGVSPNAPCFGGVLSSFRRLLHKVL